MNINEENLSLIIDHAWVKITSYLEEHDEGYGNAKLEMDEICKEHHRLMFFFDKSDETIISKKNHEIILRFLELRNEIDQKERMMLYIYGHVDGVSYATIKKGLKNE